MGHANNDIHELVESYLARATELRRHFHSNPETAFNEHKTASHIAEVLRKSGYECQEGVGRTGLTATLSNGNGPTLMIRADMDALPMEEQTGLPFASDVRAMHACGHDAHMAIAVATAEICAQIKERINGKVVFLFQPAEEVGSGALAMVNDGVLDAIKADRSIGLHVWSPEQPKIYINRELAFGGAAMFDITVHGKGGHGAAPETAVDPIPVSAQIITALQSVVSREMSPNDNVVLTIGSIHAGDADNVITPSVNITGTLRARTLEQLRQLGDALERITTSVATGMRCKADVVVKAFVPPTINNPEVAGWLEGVAKEVLGGEAVAPHKPLVGSEDMSEFLNRVPGAFFLVGAGPQEHPHHNPKFDIDERCLPLGMKVFLGCILDYLG